MSTLNLNKFRELNSREPTAGELAEIKKWEPYARMMSHNFVCGEPWCLDCGAYDRGMNKNVCPGKNKEKE
jgi:hypothetical protein